jgi:FkbM family methyltransferase
MTEQYHSQWKQDKYLEDTIFRGYRCGIFVDVGAHDGISINNTLFFEKERGWNGINVEPIKKVYDSLTCNRPNCININCAVSEEEGELNFICNEGYTEMLSGLESHYDTRHHSRNEREIKQMGGIKNIIKVQTKRLETIFTENNITHVNYLSIDVEGAEYSVIKSINFNKVFIDVIEFENNYEDTSLPIIGYLEANNYRILQKGPDIFMIHKDSKFLVI